jgi:hypothetical protein
VWICEDCGLVVAHADHGCEHCGLGQPEPDDPADTGDVDPEDGHAWRW